MPFKPNYQQQRGERDRAKELKKQEKLRNREEEAARRRSSAGQDTGGDPADQQPAPSTEGGDDGQA